MACRGRKQDADDLVLDEAQPFGAVPAVTVLQQDRLRDLARLDQLGLQKLRHRRAESILAAGMLFGERVDRRGDPHGIETLIRRAFSCALGFRALNFCHDVIHDPSR